MGPTNHSCKHAFRWHGHAKRKGDAGWGNDHFDSMVEGLLLPADRRPDRTLCLSNMPVGNGLSRPCEKGNRIKVKV